jgi:hypothetical protein
MCRDICHTELSVTEPTQPEWTFVGLLLTRAAAESLLCAVLGDSASCNYAMLRFVFHPTGGTHSEEASEYEGWRTDAVTSFVTRTVHVM